MQTARFAAQTVRLAETCSDDPALAIAAIAMRTCVSCVPVHTFNRMGLQPDA